MIRHEVTFEIWGHREPKIRLCVCRVSSREKPGEYMVSGLSIITTIAYLKAGVRKFGVGPVDCDA